MTIEIYKTYELKNGELEYGFYYSQMDAINAFQNTLKQLKDLSSSVDVFGFFYGAFYDLVRDYGVQKHDEIIFTPEDEAIMERIWQ